MTDHAISYIKCVSVPSENIRAQSKKNMELFLKEFKKRKRNLLTKLNKNQIDKSQIIQYYNTNIDQIKKIKNDRLQKIILLTNEFMENISDDEIEDNEHVMNSILAGQSNKSNYIAKKHVDNNNTVNGKILGDIVIENEKMELDLLPDEIIRNSIADVMEIIEEDEENQKEIENPNNKNVIDLTEQHDNASSGLDSLPAGGQEIDKTFDMKGITIINETDNDKISQVQTDSTKKSLENLHKKNSANEKLSNAQAKSKFAGLNTNVKVSKAVGSTLFKLPVKNSQIKTPQQPLYKSKYYPTTQGNSLSTCKEKSLVKSQTNISSSSKTTKPLSSQMKPLTEIKKPQNKIEEEKKRKLEEIKAKRKENCMKLAEIHESKKATATLQSKNNCSSIKPGIPNHFSTLPAGWSMKSNVVGHSSNLPQRPILVSNNSQKPANVTAVVEKKLNTIDKFPLITDKNQMSNALKPINVDLNAKSNLTYSNNTASQSSNHSILSEFKTPFSQKRLTILSDSCIKIIRSHESYDLSGLADVDSDEEEEDENHHKSKIPRWSRKENGTLERLVRYQMKHSNPSDIILEACHVMIDYTEVFGENATIEPGVLEEWL